MGRQDVGGVESVGTVKLLVDSVQDMLYSFLFCLHVAGVFFFLFFGEEECLLPCKPLPLELSKSLVVFFVRFWVGFFLDFVVCQWLFWSG